jgi:phosphoglycolate phosphatase
VSFQAFLESPALSIRDYFLSFFRPEQARNAESAYIRKIKEISAAPFSDSFSLLSWIHSLQIPMAVVSNKEGYHLRKEVKDLGWQDYFYCVVGSNDAQKDKPSPTPLLYALSRRSIEPGPRVWFVGDSVVDMVCAKQAGCSGVAMGKAGARGYEEVFLKVNNCKELLILLQESFRRKQVQC